MRGAVSVMACRARLPMNELNSRSKHPFCDVYMRLCTEMLLHSKPTFDAGDRRCSLGWILVGKLYFHPLTFTIDPLMSRILKKNGSTVSISSSSCLSRASASSAFLADLVSFLSYAHADVLAASRVRRLMVSVRRGCWDQPEEGRPPELLLVLVRDLGLELVLAQAAATWWAIRTRLSP